MGFMQKEITGKQQWLQIDGSHGTTIVPLDVVDSDLLKMASSDLTKLSEQDAEDIEQSMRELAEAYYEGLASDIDSVELVEGYGARMSAPGYMDCTEWAVYDSAEEAEKDLDAMYGDDGEEDEDAESEAN